VAVRDPNGLDILTADEHLRPDTTVEGLAKLRPSFAGLPFDTVALRKFHWLERLEHVHHAGNSSGIVDGAALVLIGSEIPGLTPRARIVGAAVTGADPTLMLTGPGPATRKALAVAGLTLDDIDLFEINEAFAAVVLKYIRDL